MIYLVFLESVYLWTIIAASIVVVLAIAVFLFIFLRKKSKPKVKKAEIKYNSKENEDDFFLALGGKENVVSYSLNGSRLTLVLKDGKTVNKEQLKKYGVDRTLEMSQKLILVGNNLDLLENSLKNIK